MTPEHSGAPDPRLPVRVQVIAGFLLAIPIIALAIVPVYAKDGPRLWGFPFFYWYQFMWSFSAPSSRPSSM